MEWFKSLTSTCNRIQLKNNYLKADQFTTGQAIWLNRGIIDATIDKNELIADAAAQVVFLNGPQLFHGMYFNNNNIFEVVHVTGTWFIL